MKKLDDYLEEAITNIRDDRGITKDLLDDVIRLIGKDEEHHKYVGAVAAKYVERGWNNCCQICRNTSKK